MLLTFLFDGQMKQLYNTAI